MLLMLGLLTFPVVATTALVLTLAAVTLAARRARHRSGDHVRRLVAGASAAERAHAEERSDLRQSAVSERGVRDRLEEGHRLAGVELALAARVHRSLVPEDVVRADVTVAVRHIPCAVVGGDYLHVTFARPDLLYLCVGDVSGHGVAASLVVSRIHGFIQRWTVEQWAPEDILRGLDRAALEILEHTPFFMTFAVFCVDLSASHIDFATAGHPAQWLLRADGRTVESLSSGNGILGVRGSVLGDLRATRAAFGPGDSLVLFTDGIFEVLPKGEGAMLGEDGLLASLSRPTTRSAAGLASEILRVATEFGRDGPFQDDVSLMVARFGPVPSPLSPALAFAAPELDPL